MKKTRFGSVTIFLAFSFLFFIVPILFPRFVFSANSQLLTRAWNLRAQRDSTERYQLLDANILKGNDTLTLTYNLRGLCLLGGDASALVIDQPIGKTWRYVSLSNYGKNCLNGTQTVTIPLSDFRGIDLSKPVGTFHIRIWHFTPYNIDITSAILSSKSVPKNGSSPFSTLLSITPIPPTTTPTPTRTPTPNPSQTPVPTPTTTPLPTVIVIRPTTVLATLTPTSPIQIPTTSPSPTSTPSTTPVGVRSQSWSIQSVSSMKETKDRICAPRPIDFIQKWVNKAVELGANYVSIETPYDNPVCGSSVLYTRQWIEQVRSGGLRVWHRHMPLAFEGIYDTTKNPNTNYLNQISEYIKNNPQFFVEGDIFTPVPEPQNGGIRYITYCPQNICIFADRASFNKWLRDAIDVSEAAFSQIGLAGKIKIGYYGFDGFVTWGDNNPDWTGILEDATVIKMGNLTIDHYPEVVGDTMQNDLNELEARYPNIPIIIGEWGTISGTNYEQQVLQSMQASKRKNVVGFNYWHMGMGGNEALISDTFTNRIHFDLVKSFYKDEH